MAISIAVNGLRSPEPDPNQGGEAARLMAQGFPFAIDPVTIEPHFSAGDIFHFRSPVDSPCPESQQACGRFFPCREWQTRPAVLLLHGWNAEFHFRNVGPMLGRGLNRRGLNAILLELPCHLHRRPRGRKKQDFICDDIPTMLRVAGQALAEAEALVAWAKSQGCPTVGLWGFSLGAWLAGLHICLSARPDAAVLTTPMIDLEAGIASLPFCAPVRAALAVAPVGLGRLNLTAHQPRIPPGQILLSEGLHDQFVPRESYVKLAAAWNLGRWDQFPHSHISILMSPRAMRRSMDWLAEHLRGLPAGEAASPGG